MKEKQLLTGQCLCEQVAYTISGRLGPIFNCHCSKCRRWHGSAFRTRASVKRDQFNLIRGADLLQTFNSSDNVTKYFCSVCGSNLHSTYRDRPDVIGIPLGGIEQDLPQGPKAHIFVASKAPWYTIDDNLEQFSAWPEDESVVRQTGDDA